MSKLSKILVATSLFVFSAGVMAQGKVVVFNAERAILNTEAAQAQIKKFEANANFTEMRAKAESLTAKLQEMDKQLKNEGVTWSEERKIEHRKTMEYSKADLDLEVKKIQQEQQIIIQQLLQAQAQNAQKVVQELVESEGIGLIINQQAVQYADSSYDITAKITDRLNSLNKKPAGQ